MTPKLVGGVSVMHIRLSHDCAGSRCKIPLGMVYLLQDGISRLEYRSISHVSPQGLMYDLSFTRILVSHAFSASRSITVLRVGNRLLFFFNLVAPMVVGGEEREHVHALVSPSEVWRHSSRPLRQQKYDLCTTRAAVPW